jgi:hypothetical protein
MCPLRRIVSLQSKATFIQSNLFDELSSSIERLTKERVLSPNKEFRAKQASVIQQQQRPVGGRQ